MEDLVDEHGRVKARVLHCWAMWPHLQEEEIAIIKQVLHDQAKAGKSEGGHVQQQLARWLAQQAWVMWTNPAVGDKATEIFGWAMQVGIIWDPPAGVNQCSNLPEHVLAQMAVHEGEGWRLWAARDESTPVEILQKLVRDKRSTVKAAACENRMLPVETLREALVGEKRVTVLDVINRRLSLIPQEYGGELGK